MSADARQLGLAAECDADAADLARLVSQLKTFQARLRADTNDEALQAAVALNLDRVYTATESVIFRVVTSLEGQAPSGSDWHMRLLRQAFLDVEGVRPPILAADLRSHLTDLLGFRYKLRHSYLMHLDSGRLELLAEETASAGPRTEASLRTFAGWLRSKEQLSSADH